MTPALALTWMLTVATALAVSRLVLAHARAPHHARPAVWRSGALVGLTMVSALLLHRILLPPAAPVAQDPLVVLTARWSGLPVPVSTQVVAMPEAGDVPAGTVRSPDLATALRRAPDTRSVVVVGAGLEARDLEAVGTRALQFVSADLPAGIVALAGPRAVGPGTRFEVHGRVAGVEDATLTLVDPANRPVDTARADARGAFRLSGTARGTGATWFTVAVDDVEATPFTRVTVPVVVDDAPPVRLLLLAGAPNPELRALRRWAEEAGLSLRWRVAFGAGAGVGGTLAPDAATLAEQDLVLLDARAFDALGATARATLGAAVRDGLGVLVHTPAPPSTALRVWLREAGMPVQTGRARTWQPDVGPADVARLRAWLGPGSEDVPFDPLLAGEAAPALSYLPLSGGVASDQAASGEMMRWQAAGQGRVGVVTLADSWQLPLAGRADLHAGLWSGWANTLARAGAHRPPQVQGEARVGVRVALCGLEAGARIRAPDGHVMTPLADPAAAGCAGFWPKAAGWHRIEQPSGVRPLPVRATDEAPGLHAASVQAATRARVRADEASARAISMPWPRGPWPWALAWLCVTAALWALGRARAGRRASSDPPIA